jgi:hypothetical protein
MHVVPANVWSNVSSFVLRTFATLTANSGFCEEIAGIDAQMSDPQG